MPTGNLTKRAYRKHGHTVGGVMSSTYRAWTAMIDRCRVSSGNHPHYADRGITVCARWKDFRKFLADMGERPNGLTLDRIDNDLGYGPLNCRWATRAEQMVNTRANVRLTFNGRTMTVSQWAKHLGVPRERIKSRLSLKWSVARALSEPVRGHG